MNDDGTGQRRLAGLPRRDDTGPTWSGDGRQIAFSSRGGAGNKSLIYVLARTAEGCGS